MDGGPYDAAAPGKWSANGGPNKRMANRMRVEGPSQDLCYRIIGAAMAVHNKLGPGLKEIAYHRALSMELEGAGLSYEEERPVEVPVDGVVLGLLYLDHVVDGRVIVEEKAFSHMLTDEELAQVITYLAATGFELGVLVNFGRSKLEYRRALP